MKINVSKSRKKNAKQLTNNNATLSPTENVKAVMKLNVKLLMIISAGIANVRNLFLINCKRLIPD